MGVSPVLARREILSMKHRQEASAPLDSPREWGCLGSLTAVRPWIKVTEL
jgi:hypothetical protein